MTKPKPNDTPDTNIRALQAAPGPEPLPGLTGAPATIYTELAALTEPATAAELALAAGLGRSTTSKALTTLEAHGLAVRTPGGHDGPRRTPDRWQSVLSSESAQAPESIRSAPCNTDSAKLDASGGDGEIIVAASESPLATDSATGASQATAHRGTYDRNQSSPYPEGCAADTSGQNVSISPTGAEQPMASPAVIALSGGTKRLAPGALRQRVIDHLTAHPGEAFTATKISRTIEKSSGAIANCLSFLVKHQIAEQVGEGPRTYRLIPTRRDAE